MPPALSHVIEDLIGAAEAHPTQIAVVCDGSQISYGELLRKARSVADGLAAFGIAPGTSVGLFTLNCTPFVECLYGGWMNGNVIVPMSSFLTSAQVRAVVQESDLRALVVYEPLLPHVDAAISGLESPPMVFVIGSAGRHIPYTRLLECGPRGSAHEQPPEHVLTLYPTDWRFPPRGIAITNRNVLAQLDIARELFADTESSAILAIAPLAHVLGLNLLTQCMRKGSTLMLQRKYQTRATRMSLEREGVTALVTIPAAYRMLLEPRVGRLAAPALRRCISVSGPMPPQLVVDCEAMLGAPVYEAYGWTETTGLVCFHRPTSAKPGSIGRPKLPLRVEIAAEGSAVKTGERAQIRVAGPMVTRGYPKETQPPHAGVAEDWFATQDAGYVDADGFLFIANDPQAPMRNGRPAVLLALEDALFNLHEVSDAGVCAVPDPDCGVRVRAVIVFRPDRQLDAETLDRRLTARVADDSLPDEYILSCSELPRGLNGRVDRKALSALPRSLAVPSSARARR